MSDTQYYRRLLENAAEGERKFKKSGILTDLSVDEIEKLLMSQYGDIRGKNIVVPNVSWGVFTYEMDLAVITPSFHLHEIEIKRSWSDFMADFKKANYHDDPLVNQFYYCVPKCMAEQAWEFLQTQAPTKFYPLIVQAGIYAYEDRSGAKFLRKYKNAKIRHDREIPPQFLFKLCRLSNMRYWHNRVFPELNKYKTTIDRLKFELEECKAAYRNEIGEDFDIHDSL